MALCIFIERFHYNFCFSFRLKIPEAQEVIMLQFEKYKMDHNDKLYIKSADHQSEKNCPDFFILESDTSF